MSDERERFEVLLESVQTSIGMLAEGHGMLAAKIEAVQRDMKQGFEKVDVRFNGVDARFETIDARFEKIDARFEKVDARFDALERRIDGRFDGVDERLTNIESTVGRIGVRVRAPRRKPRTRKS